MKSGGSTKPNRQVLDEASVWFVDFRCGDVDGDRRQEFRAWLQRSPEHIQAYLDVAYTYAELPRPAGGSLDIAGLVENAGNSQNVLPLTGMSRAPAATASSQPKVGKRRASGSRMVAAACALLAIVGVITWSQRGVYTTSVGEQRSLVLDDGSTLELNSRSRIRVRYTERERHIDLLEGQALFRVAKDSRRPFVVRSGATQVRAVGTEFDVYNKSTGTVVTVVEGRVVVVPPIAVTSLATRSAARTSHLEEGERHRRGRALAAKELTVGAGEQLIVRPRLIEKPARANIAAATAWTTRQLIFDGSSLAEVAEEFNRYNARRLIIHDEKRLANFHVSGTYSSASPGSLLRFLREEPGVRVVETDDAIHVSADESGV